jgi:hypothetical protein
MISIREHQEGDIEFTNHSTVEWLLVPLEAIGFFRTCLMTDEFNPMTENLISQDQCITIQGGKVAGNNSRLSKQKRLKSSLGGDINEMTVAVGRPIAWVNKALQFARSLAVSAHRVHLMCLHCGFALTESVFAPVFVALSPSDATNCMLPSIYIHSVKCRSEDALQFNPTPLLGSANNCLFRLWDSGLSK